MQETRKMESLCKTEAEHVVNGILVDVLEKVTAEASGTVNRGGSVKEEEQKVTLNGWQKNPEGSGLKGGGGGDPDPGTSLYQVTYNQLIFYTIIKINHLQTILL